MMSSSVLTNIYKEDVFETCLPEMTTTATDTISSMTSSFDLEQITDPAYHTYLDLFSCASLRIGEEDWNCLVSSDAKLAVEVGLLLLKNNKELEAVLEATEKHYEEEKFRADHLERQVKNLNQLLKTQTETYSSLELQIEDLSNKYSELLEDCSTYRKKNNTLWRRVEWLENECEDYLEEITLLKEGKENAADWTKLNEIEEGDLDEEEYIHQEEVSNTQKVNAENLFLKDKIFLYEEDNTKLLEEVAKLTKRLNNTVKTSEQHKHSVLYQHKSFRSYSEEKTDSPHVKITPTVQHYHEIFAAIFERLKTVERDLGDK